MIKRSALSLAVVFAIVGLAAVAVAAEDEEAEQEEAREKTQAPLKETLLTAVPAAQAPELDGASGDAAWAAAKPLVVPLAEGENFKDGDGETHVTLKAVYTADTMYLLAEWEDPTQSFRRSPYVKQADGSWQKLKDPDDKGGDNNKYYEDKLALIWNIGSSIKGFETEGCDVACHAGQSKRHKPFGNKYTKSAGELGDIWHMKGVRTGPVGQVDDQYLDNTRFHREKAKEAGRKSDPKTGGGYEDVALKDGKPEFMSKDGRPANAGGTYWIKKDEAVPFDDSKFKPGDEVASIIIAPFTGDRADLATAISWSNGKWTAEIARKLVTGGQYDVQFDNLDGTYPFGVAAFDNAQVRHAFHEGALQLKFAK
jgi:Ethylbenzene dehydrogenase